MENENVIGTNETTDRTEESQQRHDLPIKFNIDVNTGINLSILLILMIFCGFLFLPSKILLDTSYEIPDDNVTGVKIRDTKNFLNSMKFREKKLCPGMNYEYWITSIFFSNYDRNCVWTRKEALENAEILVVEKKREKLFCTSKKKRTAAFIAGEYNGTIDEIRATRPKSVPVTGHILAMMLVVSAVAAFVEVLRIRFINPKDTSTVETAGSRKGSTVELISHGRFFSRDTMKSQRSFELQGMQRSAMRLLGSRPPPLTRRSSFPTYHNVTTTELATISDTSTSRNMSRRESINSEAIIDSGISNLHRRARLIRRH